MGGWSGLIEIILVFGLLIAYGLYELRSLRRYKKDEKTRPDEGQDG